MRKINYSWLNLLVGFCCAVLFLITACAHIGPSSIARDRFDYVTAISDSWKRQMLLNLLKVRYCDAPVFMDVASVINAYSLAGEISLSGQLAEMGRGDQFAFLGTTGRYEDKPTITYQPLAGDKFTRSLMLPLPISGILFMIQSGYPADMVLRLCVNSVNGIRNSYGGPGRPQSGGDPKFHELMTLLREGQSTGGIGMRIKSAADKQAVVIFFNPSVDKTTNSSISQIRTLLGINATAREFNIVYSNYPENDTEIAILSRSILQIMIDMASYIDVPTDDVAEGRVYGPQRTPDQNRLFSSLLTVRHGSSVPSDAFVSVHYRDRWFWIDDRDLFSKQMLNFLMLMFSLTETGSSSAAPIVTIPTR